MSVTDDIRAHTRRNYPSDWTELDTKAVDTARVLAADAVQKAGNGHPGTAMSLAPVAYVLFQRVMRQNPADPWWTGRDRFVLSCGHTSLTLYIQLYFAGFGLELHDLETLRQWDSLCPGHPEYRHTNGVEMTTGPLGQGLASSVGMAMAARRERGLYDPLAPEGTSLFDHFIYTIASDGDLEEGVTSEASSIAGTQQLGNLVVIYDNNNISIEDDTLIAFNEDVGKRYEAYGWHVQNVTSGEDVVAIEEAITAAKAVTDKPSLIILHTVIGYPAPTKMNSGAAHGAALGAEEVAALKVELGFNPDSSFDVAPAVIEHTRKALVRGAEAQAEWQIRFEAWAAQNPENHALYERLQARKLPEGWEKSLPEFEPNAKGMATRKASGAVLAALADVLPELWGGSADLAESNNTTMPGQKSFGPTEITTRHWTTDPYGRTLHFGVREHAMGSILNGIALHGPTRPYGGTFLVFSDYMRPPVRLAAMMRTTVTYVWTHDSIGLGEDGPTHQPIEHLASLRAIPGLNVARPADANETSYIWRSLLERGSDEHKSHYKVYEAPKTDGPTALALTRQDVPTLEGTSYEGASRGGYVLADATGGDPQVVIVGTGSEVQLALDARTVLEGEGIRARVVSMPCVEWFDAEDKAYRDSVIPPNVRARVSVEAGIAMPWHRFLGDAGEHVGIEHFGASAPYKVLFEKFNITTDAVVAAAKRSLDNVKG
ncbi:transketolase [Nocardia camponoti]|uniref:Transketolase n=1 Tax=Nocardia camponoti TaxID=1616106 RepID=A0A917V5D5_9NOCA|nr:transketolase [Nocardia camponoti]GGK39025.1 transketolase [Nocardia camponoti]